MDRAYYTAGNKQNKKQKMPPKASEKRRLIPAAHRGVAQERGTALQGSSLGGQKEKAAQNEISAFRKNCSWFRIPLCNV